MSEAPPAAPAPPPYELRRGLIAAGMSVLVGATHPRLAAGTVKQLQEAMLALDNDPDGRAALEGIGFKSIVAAGDADYDAVRSLHLELLEPPTEN